MGVKGDTYKSLEDFDLGLEAIPVLNLGAQNDLDGSSLSRFLVNRPAHFAIRALAQLLYQEKGEIIASHEPKHLPRFLSRRRRQ